MHNIYAHLVKYKLAYLGVAILLTFYAAAAHTAVFSGLFSGDASHHCCKGMDFYQVPNGTFAFWHGGSLSGRPLPDGRVYAQGYFVNDNVYHPFFTLALGYWLIQFNPEQAFSAWLLLKLGITLVATGYFLWSFRESKYIGFATLVLCANCTQYLEIVIGQFQAALNVFLLLLLINLAKRQSKAWGAILYCLTLLVKPIGFLWIWVFLWKRHVKVALLGGLAFVLCTVVFLFNGSGLYYLANLQAHFLYPSEAGPNQIITLLAWLRYTTHWPDIMLKGIQDVVLISFLLISSLKRTHISKGIFLAVVYYLFFYDFVFEYHYTTLAPVVAVCIVCCPGFQTRLARCFALLTCLPSAFGLLNLWHIDTTFDSFYGANPGTLAWQWLVASKVVPVLLLTVTVLAPDAVPIYKQMKAFWLALRQANREMEVFG